MIGVVRGAGTPTAVQGLYIPLFMGPPAASQLQTATCWPPIHQPLACSLPPDPKMGNLVSFTTPKSEAANFHALSALDIDKQSVDFSAVDGKVKKGAGRCPWDARVLARPLAWAAGRVTAPTQNTHWAQQGQLQVQGPPALQGGAGAPAAAAVRRPAARCAHRPPPSAPLFCRWSLLSTSPPNEA